jgi:hypothetical protein
VPVMFRAMRGSFWCGQFRRKRGGDGVRHAAGGGAGREESGQDSSMQGENLVGYLDWGNAGMRVELHGELELTGARAEAVIVWARAEAWLGLL